MTAYKIIGKDHRRVSRVQQEVVTTEGHRTTIFQNGPMVLMPVGSIVEDVTPEELVAFKDRFAVATQQDIEAWNAKKGLVRDTFFPKEEAPNPRRIELQQEIASLQAQLDALPDPGTAPRYATDSEMVEKLNLDREALRQALAEDQAEATPTRQARAGTTRATPASEEPSKASDESPKAGTDPAHATSHSRGRTGTP